MKAFSVCYSCLQKSLSELFSNNDKVGGPLGATNKDRDLAGDPTVTFISKSWNPGIGLSAVTHGLCFLRCLLLVFALEETFSATVSIY